MDMLSEYTSREVLEDFTAGNSVDADELRVAVSKLLTGWEATVGAAADFTRVSRDESASDDEKRRSMHSILRTTFEADVELDTIIDFDSIYLLPSTYLRWQITKKMQENAK